ncbi:MAG: hypothetical protein A4E71_01004 [Smithella sp. PtaU1.Bin162]|nr:MAG: hypothetical protein A4E71_01004 [Smithella sp. PtaU1.Bin162]
MADLLESKRVKVRKPHICQGCGKKIEVGETAIVSVVADGGTVWRYYECIVCHKYAESNCYKCSDFDYCVGENYFVGLIKECMAERKR